MDGRWQAPTATRIDTVRNTRSMAPCHVWSETSFDVPRAARSRWRKAVAVSFSDLSLARALDAPRSRPFQHQGSMFDKVMMFAVLTPKNHLTRKQGEFALRHDRARTNELARLRAVRRERVALIRPKPLQHWHSPSVTLLAWQKLGQMALRLRFKKAGAYATLPRHYGAGGCALKQRPADVWPTCRSACAARVRWFERRGID